MDHLTTQTPGLSTARAAPSTVTRSMSRRSSLAHANAAPEASGTLHSSATFKTSLPGARRVAYSTSSSSSSSSSSAPGPIPRTRSSTSLAPRTSTLTGKSAVSHLSSSRARRVLSETQASGSLNNPTPSSNMARNATALRRSASASVASVASPPRLGARRYSRAEAGGLTGFGVVKAGPRVVSPVKMERESPAIRFGGEGDPVNDPYSTSFQRPTFGFEARHAQENQYSYLRDPPRQTTSRTSCAIPEERISSASDEDELYLESPRRPIAPLEPSKHDISPRKAFAPRSFMSPTKGFSNQRRNAGGGDENMATDSTLAIPIRPSSPVRGALSPRTLLGSGNAPLQTLRRTKPSRKIEEVDSSSSEDDELDFLSPRKKAKQVSSRASTGPLPFSAPTSSSASNAKPTSLRATSRIARARPSVGPASTSKKIDRSQLLRSPPPKKPVTVLPVPLPIDSSTKAASRAQPASASMQRTAGRTFPLPSSLPPVPPIPAHSLRSGSHPVPRRAQSATGSASLGLRPSASVPTCASGPPPSAERPQNTSNASSLSRLPRRVSIENVPPASTAFLPRLTSPTFVDPSLSLMSIDESQETSFSGTSQVGDASTMSSASVRSEETTKRLANLQNMLSRLQMPRKSVGVAAGRRASIDSDSSSLCHEPSTISGLDEKVVAHGSADQVGAGAAGLDNRRIAPSVAAVSSSTLPHQRRFSGSRQRSGVETSNSDLTHSRPVVASSTSTTSRRISSSFLPSQSFNGSTTSMQSDLSTLSDADMSATAVFSEPTIKAEKTSSVLGGVVAFVDVRTGEGDDSGMIFVDMLKSMGARVTTRPSSLTTHVVFKSGRASTLQFIRSCVRPPKVVGIAWVVRCAEIRQKADERAFKIVEDKQETEKENNLFAIGAGKTAPAQKRRRSMEPKALAALNSSTTVGGSANPALKASIAASLERARLRSLQFVPKVGSPLAKRVFVMPDMTNDKDDDVEE